jgi:thymidylate synthase
MDKKMLYKTAHYYYQPILKEEQLLTGYGDTVIVTGWTPKKKVLNILKQDKSKFAAIGQLYSAIRGLDYLVKNLIVNPQVKNVIGISATQADKNAQSIECLRDFFAYGVQKNEEDTHLIVKSKTQGRINSDVFIKDINELRDRIKYYHVTDLKDLIKIIDLVSELAEDINLTPNVFINRMNWRKEVINGVYNVNKDKNIGWNRRINGVNITTKTIPEAWCEILKLITQYGIKVPTGYGGFIYDVSTLTVTVTDEPKGFSYPDYYPFNPQQLDDYKAQILNDSQIDVKYTYGQRMRSWFGVDQVEAVIEKILKEKNSPSGVISLWDVKDHVTGGSPCLNHILIKVLENKLTLTALFRSNDMFGAWPLNISGLRLLQIQVLDELRKKSLDFETVEVGDITTVSESAHIYDDCINDCLDILKQYKTSEIYDSPTGNYIISRLGEKIKIEWWLDDLLLKIYLYNLEPEGNYKERDNLRILKELSKDNPLITSSHLLYILSQLVLITRKPTS